MTIDINGVGKEKDQNILLWFEKCLEIAFSFFQCVIIKYLKCYVLCPKLLKFV